MQQLAAPFLLLLIAQEMGAHYLNKLLDKVDQSILDTIGRKPDPPDVSDVEAYLDANPEVEARLREELSRYFVAATVIPPPDARLTPEDKLRLYENALNIVVTVMVRQRRDLALRGFLNSPDVLSLFVGRDDLPAVEATGRHITLGEYLTDGPVRIYLHPLRETSVSPEQLNRRVRELRASSESYAALDQLGADTGLVTESSRVHRIFPNHLVFDEFRYRAELTGLDSFSLVHGGAPGLPELEKLDKRERQFHLLTNPYPGLHAMVDSLATEADRIYLPPEEAQQFLRFADRMRGLIDAAE